MWALRRSANNIRIYTNQAALSRLSGVNLDPPNNNSQYSNEFKKPSQILSFFSPTQFFSHQNFSTESNPKSIDKESDEIDEFSEVFGHNLDSESDSDSNSNSKFKKETRVQKYKSPLFKHIMEQGLKESINDKLEKWIKDGNKLEREEVLAAIYNLRIRKFYQKALQFMEFLKNWEQYEFSEREYVTYLDLTAKVRGIYQAEKYLEKIPQSMHNEVIYRGLLANCVTLRSVQKAEQIFKKMQDLGFELTPFTCNQLLLLYRRTDRKKVSDVLLMMEKNNIKITGFMYKTLIDIKGSNLDIAGIEELLNKMKTEDFEPDYYTLSLAVKYYIKAGRREKAEEIIREIEGPENNKNRAAYRFILPLYADLGLINDVYRVWNLCESDPFMEESLSAIYSFGKINKVDDAEKVFDEMSKKWKKLSVKYHDNLLKVYADHKLLEKGKNIVRNLIHDGRLIGPSTLDALIRLYVNSGEVRKGDLFLQKWLVDKNKNKNKIKPWFNTYLILLEGYANKGDYHNAENIFGIIRGSGFSNKVWIYSLLLRAYVNAKVPAYGFRERMKSDNLVVSGNFIGQLAQVDGFKKSDISDCTDLLD